MKVYITGPMTGYPAYNVGAFEAAAEAWTLAGHTAATPFEANSIVWQKHHGVPFDPQKHKCDYGDPILSEMFAEDMRVLSESDAIAMLPGWENSRGTRIEILLALTFGKQIFDAITRAPIHLTASVIITPKAG